MKTTIHKLTAITLFVCMALTTFVLPATAISPKDKLMAIDEKWLKIDEATACEMAMLFVSDMILSENTVWDETTRVTRVVSMYDEEREVNSYAVELTEGYIIISAYVDVPDIILEWSDVAEPLYTTFDVTRNDRIMYTGILAYYKDSGGKTIETLSHNRINRSAITNELRASRDISNISAKAMKSMSSSSDSASTRGTTITDPFADATRFYPGPFRSIEWANYWENYASFYTVPYFQNTNGQRYNNHCGPTAITNLLIMHGKRFNTRPIQNSTAKDIFATVADIGSMKYYFNWYYGGTLSTVTDRYILDAFDAYGVGSVRVTGRHSCNYYSISNALTAEKLLFLMLSTSNTESVNPYGDHAVIGYAYTRLKGQSSAGGEVVYVKIADGWNSSPRYISLVGLTHATYWEVSFFR